ncbi:MAG: alpha/beta hydrolase [Mycobacteriaceae bacterium]|nr:alpha/beta hydrolase [Mycobacteriaceae bacterium]
MRDRRGRSLSVGGAEVYLEEGGSGDVCAVFEAGAGAGRTLWDPVTAQLDGSVHTVAYDRVGRGRSKRAGSPQGIDEMAATLVALIEAIRPNRLILVAHSMGGLVVRRAVDGLATPLAGLVLVDPTPELAPFYDDWSPTVRKTDRALAVQQWLARSRPVMRKLTGSYGRLFAADTYAAMLAEDFSPAGIAQTRNELRAVAAAIAEFRSRPPQLPDCPVTVLSATRAARLHARNHDAVREYQRRYAEQVNGQFEDADSEHIVPAERPEQVAAAILRLARL